MSKLKTVDSTFYQKLLSHYPSGATISFNRNYMGINTRLCPVQATIIAGDRKSFSNEYFDYNTNRNLILKSDKFALFARENTIFARRVPKHLVPEHNLEKPDQIDNRLNSIILILQKNKFLVPT